MTTLFYINGKFLRESEARIPVMDRGFLFGDSIYEVVVTRKGRLLAMDRHLQRLRGSASRILLRIPFSDAELNALCRDLVERADNAESYLRIILTRGTGMAPNIDLAFAPETPNLVLMVRPMDPPPSDLMTRGLSAWIVSTTRNDPRSLDPAIKSGNYLNNILGLMEARKRGADTAFFLNREGELTEAPTSNIWIVREGRTMTPPLEAGILAGITRALVLEMGEGEDLPISETHIRREDLKSAEEIFLTSTTTNLAPVTTLDGKPVGDGRVGSLTLDLSRRFERFLDTRI